jgi:hypothetical protein
MIKYSEQKYAANTIEVNYVEGPDNGPPMVFMDSGVDGRPGIR